MLEIHTGCIGNAAASTQPRCGQDGAARARGRIACVLLALLLAAGGPAWAAKQKQLYRWVDQEGNVHYSDSIPASAAGQGHDALNKQGVTQKTVEPPKSKEEYLREQEMERLRAEQKKLIDEQQAADRVLLATYRTEDEILLARDGKIAAIDATVTVILSNLQRQKRLLTDLQSEAAGHERRGQKIPPKLQTRMDEAQKAIAGSYESIVRREQQKDTLRSEYEASLTRFRDLKQLSEGHESKGSQGGKVAQSFAELDNVVVCDRNSTCGDLWARAKAFAERNATTSLQLFGANIHMTGLPKKDKDISITLSLIPNREGQNSVIFMDLQCGRTPVGQAFCEGPEVAKLRKQFKETLSQAQ